MSSSDGRRIHYEVQRSAMRLLLLSPFQKKYRMRRGQQKLDPRLRIMIDHVASTEDRKIALVKNSKAACTTIANVLYHYNHGAFPDGSVHRPDKQLRQGSWHWRENADLILKGDPFLITSVRDPLRRAVSGFTNFFVDCTNPMARRHFGPITGFGWVRDGDPDRNFDVFLDYVEASLQADPLNTDRHWRRQVTNTAWDLLDYDYVAKVESLYDDLEKIAALSGIEDTHGSFSQRPTSNKSKKSSFKPSEAQAERVFKLYEEDYDTFGYSRSA